MFVRYWQCAVMGAALVAAAVANAGPVAEYADIAGDVVGIAGDVHGVLADVAADKGVHDAARSLVSAWGDLREAVGALRHGGTTKGVVLLAKAGESVSAAYESLHGDPDLADAVARLQDIAARVADIVTRLQGGGGAALGSSPPDMGDLSKAAQSVLTSMDQFASCFATGEAYSKGPESCGNHDWIGETAAHFSTWTKAALMVVAESGGAT